ncbi:unnamed protein product [Gulo gulo]|uniref:Uncharacterized protein n=1 Tax=Gulo gulo TaxID=48420 RepID=A0A9X9LV54_GULGU|nr:unnamed protein product [Gulo gulo]
MPHRGLLLAAPAGPVQAHSPSASIALPNSPAPTSVLIFLFLLNFEPFSDGMSFIPYSLFPPSSSSFSFSFPSTHPSPFSIYSLF